MKEETQESAGSPPKKHNRRQFTSRTLMGMVSAAAVSTPIIHGHIKSLMDNYKLMLNEKLSEAVSQQDVFCANQCIQEGADVNYITDDKCYPLLSRAAWHGNAGMIHLLVANGADTGTVDTLHRTALHCAIDHVIAVDTNTDINFRLVDALLNHMSRDTLDAQNSKGKSALSVLLHHSFSHAAECKKLGTTQSNKLLTRIKRLKDIADLMIIRGCNVSEQDALDISNLNNLIEQIKMNESNSQPTSEASNTVIIKHSNLERAETQNPSH